MTEQTTDIDLSSHTGREIGMSYYTFSKEDHVAAQYKALKLEIEDKLARGEPVYVKFSDHRRRNSVGRIKSCTFKWNESKGRTAYWRSYGDIVYAGIEDIVVVWDGRSNKVKPYHSEIKYLPDWDKGTNWFWEQTVKPKVEPVIAYDHLGQELEIGQNVCFVHRRYGSTDMKFGTVTRFTPKGSVYVKVMKLKDGQYDAGQELKALSMDDVVIVNDTLMKRLVMAKLSAN